MGLPETILLIVVLALGTMALIVLEVCTPSFGVLTLAALSCAAGAVYLCYRLDSVAGLVATVVAVVGLPAYGYLAVKIIPRTPLGRLLILKQMRGVFLCDLHCHPLDISRHFVHLSQKRIELLFRCLHGSYCAHFDSPICFGASLVSSTFNPWGR